MNAPIFEMPKWILSVMNNLSEIERKLAINGDAGNAKRNIERIKEAFEGEKIFYEDPMGQKFSETRTDLEAMITGEGTDNLVVIEVVKPIVRFGDKNFSKVVQKGIVVVASQTSESKEEGNN